MGHYPLVLARPAVRRLTERKATVLIFSRHRSLGRYEIQDALTVQRNEKAKRRGRIDLMEDPHVMTIELDSVREVGLLDLAFTDIRRAGFRTSEDFYLDWLHRHKRVDPDRKAFIYGLHLVDDVRFLHTRVHRGYTSNPGLAVRGEPEALSQHDLDQLAKKRAQRDALFDERATRSIKLRAKRIIEHGDPEALISLARELALVKGTAGSLMAGTALA